MGLIHDIIHPESFLGLTDLKTGSLIIAGVDFLMTVIAFIGTSVYNISFGILVALVCTGLGVYGILNNNKTYVLIYEIYLIVNTLISGVVFIFSFISFSLTFIVRSFILFVISLYACRVVTAYYKQMEGDGVSNKATDAANKVVDAVDAAAAKV